jgi:hypothetical protein
MLQKFHVKEKKMEGKNANFLWVLTDRTVTCKLISQFLLASWLSIIPKTLGRTLLRQDRRMTVFQLVEAGRYFTHPRSVWTMGGNTKRTHVRAVDWKAEMTGTKYSLSLLLRHSGCFRNYTDSPPFRGDNSWSGVPQLSFELHTRFNQTAVSWLQNRTLKES